MFAVVVAAMAVSPSGSLLKRVVSLNRSGVLASPLRYTDVRSLLETMPEMRALSLLADLEQQAAEVSDPLAFLQGRAAAQKREPCGTGAATRSIDSWIEADWDEMLPLEAEQHDEAESDEMECDEVQSVDSVQNGREPCLVPPPPPPPSQVASSQVDGRAAKRRRSAASSLDGRSGWRSNSLAAARRWWRGEPTQEDGAGSDTRVPGLGKLRECARDAGLHLDPAALRSLAKWPLPKARSLIEEAKRRGEANPSRYVIQACAQLGRSGREHGVGFLHTPPAPPPPRANVERG